jgi:hypothetical protein
MVPGTHQAIELAGLASAQLSYLQKPTVGLGMRRDRAAHGRSVCEHMPACRAAAKEIEAKGNKGRTALIRMYPIPHTVYHPHGCWMSEPGAVETMPIDPCHWSSEWICNPPTCHHSQGGFMALGVHSMASLPPCLPAGALSEASTDPSKLCSQ